MDLGLAGKTAIVTGGGSGIGKAICHVLANEGAHVGVVDLRKERAEAVAHEIAKGGVKAMGVAADSPGAGCGPHGSDDIEGMGGLDVLINNAGIISGASGGYDGAAMEQNPHQQPYQLFSVFAGCRPAND